MRILVVEDDPDQRQLLVSLLGRRGIRCWAAGSLRDGLRLIEDKDTRLLVTDWELGDGFAQDLIDAAAKRDMPYLVVTGRGPTELPAQLPYLRKPIDLQLFLHKIEEAFHPAQKESKADLELKLYVSEASPFARRAQSSLQKLSLQYPGRVHLDVVDVGRDPSRVDPEDRVMFTPTLVRRRPEPRLWLVGDLEHDLPRILGLE